MDLGGLVEDVVNGEDNIVSESDESTIYDEGEGGDIVVDELCIDEEAMPEVVKDDVESIDEDKGMDEGDDDESASEREDTEGEYDDVGGDTNADEESSVHSSEYSFNDNNVFDDSDVTYEMEGSELGDQDEDQREKLLSITVRTDDEDAKIKCRHRKELNDTAKEPSQLYLKNLSN